jgi:tetratricopeptide (TPR) repeat protein
MVIAVPEKYRNTGRESYYIDEEGFLRGEDISGEDPAAYKEKTSLAKLSQDESIYVTFGEELAGDIFRAIEEEMRIAEKDPENKAQHYLKAESIAEAIKKYFPMSSKASSLNAVTDLTQPVIIEYRSVEEYKRAMASLDENKPLRALEILKNAETTYPTASNIMEIRDKIAEIQEKYLKELEAEAKALYDEAKKKELEGNIEVALENYTKIRDKYDKTNYAKDIESLIEAVQAKIKEKKAEDYISELQKLSFDKDSERIINLTELINRDYSKTEAYSKNTAYLSDLSKKSQALALVAQAIKSHDQDKDYRVALQTFKRAIEEYPDVRSKIKKYLESCYLWNGKYALDEKDYRKALEYFVTFRSTSPDMTKQTKDYLAAALPKAYFEVGKLDFQQGNIEQAEAKLFVAAGAYRKDPEFNYFYGSVLLNRKQYYRAIEAFNASVQNKTFQIESFRKRGYARIEYAFSLENKLRDILIENEEYQYLLDVDKIKAGKRAEELPEQKGNGAEQKNPDDGKSDGDEKNKENLLEKRFFDGKTELNTHRTIVAGNSDDEGGSNRVLAQVAEQPEKELQGDYPLKRILDLIEDIEKGKDTVAQEEADSQGDKRKKEQLLLKKTKMIEEYQTKYASIKIGLEKDTKNKEDILRGIQMISAYFLAGIEDLSVASQLSARSREVEDLQQTLKSKLAFYTNAYNNLSSALQTDRSLQATSIQNLTLAIDQFKGWGKRANISKNLKYAFLVSPSKEAAALGLDELEKALDVTVDTSVILRSSGTQ